MPMLADERVMDLQQGDLFGYTPPASPYPEPQSIAEMRMGVRPVPVSQVCHELRTALNHIVGFSEVMCLELHGPLGHPKYAEYVSHVQQSGSALLAVADAVLEIAGRDRRSY